MFESTEDLAVHKLLLLYLLKQLDFSVPNTKLTQLILEKNYMDYFLLQQYLGELIQSRFILSEKNQNKISYKITNEGKKILEYFSNRISQEIRSSIDEYVLKNKSIIKQEMDITAEYIPEKTNEYIVYCSIKENSISLIDLKVNVVSKEQAKIICNNFKTNAQQIYSKIMNDLLSENKSN